MSIKKFITIFFIAITIIYVTLRILDSRTTKSCENETGIYLYERFSKSLDPIKEEYTAKRNYILCLTRTNLIYRYIITNIFTNCTNESITKTGGKSDMQFPISEQDWYLYGKPTPYNGFTSYVNMEGIECLKKSQFLDNIVK